MKKLLLILPMLILMLGFVSADSLTLVSGTDAEYKDGGSWYNAMAVSDVSVWDSTILPSALPGAVWIWNSDGVTDEEAVLGSNVMFRQKFDLGCVENIHGTISITSDDGFTLRVNSDEIATNSNWNTMETYDISASLLSGQGNTLVIEAVNAPLVDGTPATNPAGVIYKADITYDKVACNSNGNDDSVEELISAVSGTVTDGNGNVVPDADVDVTCNGVTESAVTNALGDYYVEFDAGVCYFDDPVSATATKDEVTGSNDGVMCNAEECFIPIGIVDITIPEFGLIAGAVALVGALGIFMYRRK
ncbi:MAG: carboxypeptidase-like regulatory domain-containing protein [Candidatus Woesearchaeota archaeon]